MKKCEYCNKNFYPKDPRTRTCSRVCSGKLSHKNSLPVSVNCRQCEKPFLIKKSKVDIHGNYCSDACREKKKEFLLNCITCKKDYIAKKPNGKYCSIPCEKDGQRKQLLDLQCFCCKKAFQRPSFTVRKNTRVFCSTKCRNRTYSQENPNRYGSRWARIRERFVKKHDYTCMVCGERNEEKYGLEVHHVVPINEFFDPEDGNVETNLMVLCKTCHKEKHNNN